MKTSIVLGTYNRLKYLKLTIDTVRKEMVELDNEIIVIDGGSNDGTRDWITRQKDIISIVQHNRGLWKGKNVERKSWGYFMNLGFKIAKGKYMCMLSDDCLVIPGAIRNGIDLFENELKKGKKIGAMAFYWRNWPEQKKYWVGLTLGKKIFVNHGLFLRKALEDVGYADENTFFFYHADGDLSLKLWRYGYSVIESGKSFIEHHSHANQKVRLSNLDSQRQDWTNYLKKWRNIFYFPEDKYEGGWREKEYEDINNTANKFPGGLVRFFKSKI